MTPPPAPHPDVLPRPIRRALGELGVVVHGASPYRGEQRHSSVRLTTTSGVLWLKRERERSPVAGVAREVAVLNALADRRDARAPWLTPRVILSGSLDGAPYAVTEGLGGHALTDVPAGHWCRRLAAALADFADRRPDDVAACRPNDEPTPPDEYDLFGSAPDLGRLLDESPARDEAERVTADHIVGRVRSEPIGLVHGSFDTGNVLHGTDRVAFLDLEAARPGPASIDVAAMTAALFLDSGAGPARAWLRACRSNAPNFVPPNVAGNLLLRLRFRRTAGRLTRPDEHGLLALVAELAAA